MGWIELPSTAGQVVDKLESAGEMEQNGRRAALHNLGCKVNAYETEKMKAMLEAGGYEVVDFAEEADVYVINTCSVTAIADKKSRQMIHRARRRNPQAIVVAAGCYVQRPELTPESLDCDIILGNDEKQMLLSRIARFEQDGTAQVARHDINEAGESFEELFDGGSSERIQPAGRTRAFVKVQDGCDQFCTYCRIPYVRGRSRSRSLGSVLAEIRALCGQGYQEIVLTGIHISSYDGDGCGLIGLCEAIDRQTAVRRLRLGSLEPRIVTEDFVRRLADLPSVCPHFHLSLQSGSDTVIQRMNRKYTTADFADSVALLRRFFDNPAVTTDVIAGFPGETETEFAKGRAFLEQMQFYEMHVFPYSRREGTRAARMDGQLPNRVRQERARELIALAQRMSREYRRSWQGREVEVLFEEAETMDGIQYWSGFTREYVRVSHPSDKELANQICQIIYDAKEL